MRQPLLAIALFTATGLSAQITIGEADMPNANDTLRYRTTVATGVDVAFTGAGVTWDMRALLPQLEAADTTVAVSATPFLYQLFFNNAFLYPQNRADYGVKGTDFDLMAFSMSQVYDYFRADGNGFFNVGFGANVNGLPTSVRRQPTDRILPFPLDFGSTDVSNSAFEVTVPSVLFFGQDQLRTTEVDGWGTLILPADTFEVLRVRSVLQRTDTIFVNQFNMGFRIPEPETIEYKWIALGMGKPVLEVTSVGGVATTAEFYYEPEEIITAVEQDAARPLQVYPNPANRELRVAVEGKSLLRMRDATGRVVLEHRTSGVVERLDVSGLAEGTYVLECLGAERTVKTTVMVVR